MNINKLKSLFIMTALSSTTVLFAAEEAMSIDQKLGSLKLEKMQAEVMVATMVKRGYLNNDEATRIKREIASVKEEDVETIKAEALENLNTKNSFANK